MTEDLKQLRLDSKDMHYYRRRCLELEEKVKALQDEAMACERAMIISDKRARRYREALEWYAYDAWTEIPHDKKFLKPAKILDAKIVHDYGHTAKEALKHE